MSKLLDKLDRISKGNAAPMGFGATVSLEKTPPLLVIGIVRKDYVKGAKSMAKAQGDASLFHYADTSASVTADARKALGPIPWGVWSERLELQDIQKLKEQGCDFLAFPGEGVALEALEESETGRILVLPVDTEDRVLRTLDDLPVDAVLIRLADPKTSPLRLEHLIQIGAIRSMTSKYLLVERPVPPSQRELEALRDAGVDAVAVDVATAPADQIAQARQALLELPQRKTRAERPAATLPYVGTRPAGAGREEEEEEDL